MRPRLISKEQARMVAHAGGLIGVWTHLSDTPAEYARNTCLRPSRGDTGIQRGAVGDDRFAAASKSVAVEGDRRKTSDSTSLQKPGTDRRTTRLWHSKRRGESLGVSSGRIEQPQAAELEMARGEFDV